VEETIKRLNDIAAGLSIEWQIRSEGGFTVAEYGTLMTMSLKAMVEAADVIPISGTQRKELVMHYAGELFDKYASQIVPLYLKPAWWLLAPAARQLALSLASGMVEAILPMVRGDE
jgi:hypothetical protein